ncbi:MAG: hypothetical protein GYB68_06560 [Chloroflexi bacterium]|nr:hypothetical protein [Chloroflexota bacterium]
MQSQIEVIEGNQIVVVTWPKVVEHPRQEIIDVHAELRKVFVSNGWERGVIIHDITHLDIDFGSLVQILGELSSKDAAWLSERAVVRHVGPGKLTEITVGANRQDQYSGGARNASAHTTLNDAIEEAKTLLAEPVSAS